MCFEQAVRLNKASLIAYMQTYGGQEIIGDRHVLLGYFIYGQHGKKYSKGAE